MSDALDIVEDAYSKLGTAVSGFVLGSDYVLDIQMFGGVDDQTTLAIFGLVFLTAAVLQIKEFVIDVADL